MHTKSTACADMPLGLQTLQTHTTANMSQTMDSCGPAHVLQAEAIKQPCFTKEQRALHAMAFRAYLGGVIMDSAKARKNGVAQPTGGFLKGLRSTWVNLPHGCTVGMFHDFL